MQGLELTMLRSLFRHCRLYSSEKAVSIDDFTAVISHNKAIRVLDLWPPRFEEPHGPPATREQFSQRMQVKLEQSKSERPPMINRNIPRSSRVKPTAVDSFQSFSKLDRRVVEALKSNNLVTPTAVQSGMFTEWFKSHNDLLIKAQTGTGKSVGYVALLYNEYYKNMERPLKGRLLEGKFMPSNIIIVPNLILADQLRRWFELLTSTVQDNIPIDQKDLCRVAATEESDEPGRCNVLIGSGKALNRLLYTNALLVDNIDNVIVDEADSVVRLLKKFAPLKERENRAKHPVPAQLFLEQLITLRPQARFLYASATMNCEMKSHLKRTKLVRPGAVFVEAGDTPTNDLMDTHWECPRSITHRYTTCDIEDLESLVMQISEIVHMESGRQGIVIVPDSMKRMTLLEMIHSFNIPCALVSSYNPATSPATQLLLGTEMDIRGLDIPSLQFAVVVGECDGGVAGYVHAVGRVGRMGRPGNAYTLLQGDTQVMRYLAMMRNRLNIVPLPVPQQYNP